MLRLSYTLKNIYIQNFYCERPFRLNFEETKFNKLHFDGDLFDILTKLQYTFRNVKFKSVCYSDLTVFQDWLLQLVNNK